MPVGAWVLEYGCNTIADPLRVSQYVANAQDPAYCVDGVNQLSPYAPAWTNLDVNCNCDALNYTAETPGATPTLITPYTSPQGDGAPWYTSLIEESKHFWGFVLEKAEDISTAPTKRSVTERITPLGGATLGRLRKGARVIKFTLLAFGAYESAMDYGYRWLGDQLTSQCAQCETCDLTFRTSCPPISAPPTYEEWDTGRWTLKDVGIVDGPRYEDPPVQATACNVRRISFTMVAGVPHAFKCPAVVLDQASWIPNLYTKSTVVDDALIWVDSQFSEADEQVSWNKGSLGLGLFPEHAIYGATAGAVEASDPKLLLHDANHVYLPGTAGNSVTLPDHADFDVTGPLELIGRWGGDTSPAADSFLVMKGSSYATRAYAAVVRTTGHLALQSRDSASNARDANSTVVIPYADNVKFWWRITAVPSTGVVNFYTAADSVNEPTTWTQLGATVTLALYVGATFLSNAEPVTISAEGTHYSVKIRAAGFTKLHLDFTEEITSGGQTAGTDPISGQAFTINRSASGARSVAVTRNTWLFNGSNYLHIPIDPAMEFVDDAPFTMMTFSRTWADGDQLIAGKMTNFAAGSTGYALGTTAAGGVAARLYDGVTNEVSTVAMDLGVGEVHTMVRNPTTLTTYRSDGLGGVTVGTAEPDSTTNLTNALAELYIGRDSTGTHPFYGEIFAVLLWDRALSQAEIVEAGEMFRAGGYMYCPPLSWICEADPKTCASVTNTFGVGEDALIVEIYASKTLENLEINITPDTFGYVCDPSTAPADYVAPEPCDTITIPVLPAGYTLRYDATIQRITVTLPGGEVRDGTPYIDADHGSPPSFPTIKCGTFCVCVSSSRCSWLADSSNVSVWTVHRELTI